MNDICLYRDCFFPRLVSVLLSFLLVSALETQVHRVVLVSAHRCHLCKEQPAVYRYRRYIYIYIYIYISEVNSAVDSIDTFPLTLLLNVNWEEIFWSVALYLFRQTKRTFRSRKTEPDRMIDAYTSKVS